MSAQHMEAARALAAQCWCDDRCRHIEMDVRLAEVFAEKLAPLMADAVRYRWLRDHALGSDWESIGHHTTPETTDAYIDAEMVMCPARDAAPIPMREGPALDPACAWPFPRPADSEGGEP